MSLEKTKAAHAAVSHWWMQRVTAVALLPLSLWFLFITLPHLGGSYTEVSSFFQTLSGVVPALLLTVLLFYHGVLGIQVIIEDYIPEKGRKFSLILVKGASFGGALAGVLSLLSIYLG